MKKASRILSIIGAIALGLSTITIIISSIISFVNIVSNQGERSINYSSNFYQKIGINVSLSNNLSLNFFIISIMSLLGILIACIIALVSKNPFKNKTICRTIGIFGLIISTIAIVIATVINANLSNNYGYSAEYIVSHSPYFIFTPGELYPPAIILFIISFIMTFIRKVIDNNKTKGIIGAVLFVIYLVAILSFIINANKKGEGFKISNTGMIFSLLPSLLFLFNFRFFNFDGEAVVTEKKYKPKKLSASASTPKASSKPNSISNAFHKDENKEVLYKENGMYFSNRE